MKYENLGDLVLDALEEYKTDNGIDGRFKKIDRFMLRYNQLISYISPSVTAAAGYLLAMPFAKIIWGSSVQFTPEVLALFRFVSAASFSLAGKTLSMGLVPRYLGNAIYSKTKPTPEKGVQKIGKIFRHPLILGTTSSAILTIANNYHHLFSSNYQKVRYMAFAFIAGSALLSTICYILRDVEHQGKEGWKSLGAVFKTIPAKLAGLISPEKKISMLEKVIEKSDSLYLREALVKTLLKKNMYEGLNYSKELIDEMKHRDELVLVKLKKWALGINAMKIFRKNDRWSAVFDFQKKIREVDNEAAKKIVQHIRKSIASENVDVHFLLNYFSENYIENSQEIPWGNFAKNIIALSERDKKIKEFHCSEGRVWVYTGSKLINRSLVLKEYDFDFFERFLKQRFEYEALRNSEVKTENPLVFMRQGEKSIVLTTREGDSNLREYLKDKSNRDKKLAFKKIVGDGLLAQKLLFEKIRKEKEGYYADVTFAQVAHSTLIPVLDLEEHLLHRAVLGDDTRIPRFGENVHLSELLDAVREFRQNNYSSIITTMNHGDYFTTNLSEKYSRFDSKHIITDCLFDMTYLALDPVFLELGREEKAEVVFKALGKIREFTDEKKFLGTFDYLLLHNGLGLSASQQAHNEKETAAAILSKTLEVAKGKNYERALFNYLKESNARYLIKII